MSAALLAKLKVKKQPKTRESVEIVVQVPAKKEDVSIRIKVVDMTKTSGIDREEFMKRIVSQEVAKKEKPRTPPLAIPEKPLVPKKKRKRLKLVEAKPDKPSEEKAKEKPGKPSEEKPPAKKLTIKRRTKKPIGIVLEGPASMLKIGDEVLANRLGKKDLDISVRASSYYMNNREIFVNFMSSLFGPYKEELRTEAGKASCTQADDTKFEPMPHQKIVRDYINLYTPYRGLLLYHGLGSGKTCSSVAIAEGMKTDKQIIVMTPASLRMNYIEELKKCGDELYRKNQFWEFVSTRENPELIEPIV